MTELPLKATLKAGRDYDAPWLTVDGADADDLTFKLNAIANGGLTEALVNAANTLKAVNSAAPIAADVASPPQAAPAQPQGWGQPATPAPAPVAEPTWASAQPQQQAAQFGGPANGSPHPEGVRCQGCGTPVQYKAFTSKAGKNLKMWTCPQQRSKGDGHFSEFVN